jgi:hypothetical protein
LAQEKALRAGDIDIALLGTPCPKLKDEFCVQPIHKTPMAIVLPEDVNQLPHPGVVFIKLRKPKMSLTSSAVWREEGELKELLELIALLHSRRVSVRVSASSASSCSNRQPNHPCEMPVSLLFFLLWLSGARFI